MDKDSIRKIIIKLLKERIKDWDMDFEEGIGPETSLVNDLGFNSIDIIQLCMLIERNFKRKFNFAKLLMKDGKYVPDLKVEQVVCFIEKEIKDKV